MGGNFKNGTKITKIISYLLIISMIMTGLAHAAEGLNSSNGIGTYEENYNSRDVQNTSMLMLAIQISVGKGKVFRI